MKSKQIIIGLTGGVATGKTTASEFLRKEGYLVIDADEIAHRITKENTLISAEIIQKLGNSFCNLRGEIDRKKLGDLVFHDTQKRKQLESIIHPLVLQEIKNAILANHDKSIIFVSVPLLIETSYYKEFEYTILIYAPYDVQLDRLVTKRKLTKEYAQKILQSQMPIENKKQYVDCVVDNTESIETLCKRLKQILQQF